MHFIPEKAEFAEIFILIRKTGQTKKQFQEMRNTIYFLWQSTNLAMPCDFIIVPPKIL